MLIIILCRVILSCLKLLRPEPTYSGGGASYRIGMAHHCSHCHLLQSMYIQTHLDHGVVGPWSRGWGGSNCCGPQIGAQSTFLSRSWCQWCCQLLCGPHLAGLARPFSFRQYGSGRHLEKALWQGPISTAPHEVLLFFYLAHFNFQHSAEHVPGVLNTAADAISRNNLPHLSSLLPQTPQTRILQSLVDLLVKQTPN